MNDQDVWILFLVVLGFLCAFCLLSLCKQVACPKKVNPADDVESGLNNDDEITCETPPPDYANLPPPMYCTLPPKYDVACSKEPYDVIV